MFFKYLFCWVNMLIPSTFSSQNIRQSGIVVDCWQYTYSYEIWKWFVNQRVKSRIDLEFLSTRKLSFTVRNICGITSITCSKLKETKSENNSFSDHLFFYRPWDIRSFIHPPLDIVYGFRLDASENRLCYTLIQLYFTLFIQKWNHINYLPEIRWIVFWNASTARVFF